MRKYITPTYKIIKVYPVQKSNSSYGNYVIPIDIQWPGGLTGNTFNYYWRKSEAIKDFNKLINNEEVKKI